MNKKEDSRWRKWTIKKIHFSPLCLPSRRKLFLTGLSVICLSQLCSVNKKSVLEGKMVCLAF